MQCVQVAYKWYYSYQVSYEDELVICVIMPLFWLLQNNVRTYPTFHEYMNMVFDRIRDIIEEEKGNEQ